MRAPHQLLYSRTRVRSRYALMPIEGYPTSKLPDWPESAVQILAAPVLGAAFAQYLLRVPANYGTHYHADRRIETFLYVLDGEYQLLLETGNTQQLSAGNFVFVPPSLDYSLEASTLGTLLMLKKAYEPVTGVSEPQAIVAKQSDVAETIYMGDQGALLQTLLPDEIGFDMAMNIFTFAPGHSLPVVETHVMEHGLYFLQGKGVYYLDDTWMEVEAGDFIWMGPYVPQSFYATGPTPSKYIYYKNVNRDVAL
jgi:(S)-ureidoglycine aminohydrolase